MPTALLSLLLLVAAGPVEWEPLGEPGSGGRMTALRASPHAADHFILCGDMLGVGVSFDAGETWRPAGFGLISYEIGDVTFHPSDPDVVWLGTMSGPARSDDGGVTWTMKRTGLPPVSDVTYSAPVERVLFDPDDEDTLFAFGGSSRGWVAPGDQPLWGAVWRSGDGGESWTQTARLPGNIRSAHVAAGGRVWAAVAGHGVFVSDDAGESFEHRGVGLRHRDVYRLAAHPGDSDTMWVSLGSDAADGPTPGGIWQTTDAGRTWRPRNNGLAQHESDAQPRTSRYQALAASPSEPGRLVTCDASWDISVMYVSDDGGGSWTATATDKPEMLTGNMNLVTEKAYPAGMNMEFIAWHPTEANTLLACGSETAFVSRDGGWTWDDITADPTTRPGDGWTGRGFSGLVTEDFAFDPQDADVAIFQAMDAARVWRTADRGESWTMPDTDGPWSGGRAVSFGGGGFVVAAFGQHGFDGVGVSTDGGETWRVTRDGFAPHGDAHANDVIAAGDTAYISVGDTLHVTRDRGETWQVFHEHDAEIGHLAMLDGDVVATTGSGVLWLTAEGDAVDLGGPASPGRLATDGGVLYVAAWRADDGGLWRYEGGAWEKILDDRFAADIAIDPRDPRRLAVVTDDHPYHDASFASGVYLSDDRGETWTAANDGLPVLRGSVIRFDPHVPGRLVVGTGGRGFWQATWE